MISLNGARRETTIAVDVMGGDNAPHETLAGAIEAHRRGVKVVLVGPLEVVEPELERQSVHVPVVHAPEAIAMDEPVMQSLRRKESSLHLATQLVASGDADAAVSCGNSGAIMGIALHILGMQPGIDRPAFGTILPSEHGGVFLLDIGANPIVKTSNLVQFAVMGDVYMKVSRGLAAPRVALLSNGTEDSKGTKEVREANQVLRKLDMNFVGNVEGNQIFDGQVDVVVCDGFTGNVLLKSAEGVAMHIFQLIRNELTRDTVARLAALALKPGLTRIRRRVDYEEYGGVPVLGVNGIIINCHGRSRAKAVTNAILLAERMGREQLVRRIGEALQHEDVEVGRTRRLARALHLRHDTRA